MQVVFINECKPCEISNQMVFNVMFSFSKTKEELVMNRLNPVLLLKHTPRSILSSFISTAGLHDL